MPPEAPVPASPPAPAGSSSPGLPSARPHAGFGAEGFYTNHLFSRIRLCELVSISLTS